MAIVKMKKLRMLASRSHKDELLREMMLIGCVEMTEPSFDPLEVGLQMPAYTGSDSPERIRAKIDRLSMALSILDKYAPAKTSFLSPLPDLSWSKLEEDGEQEKLKPMAEEIIFLDDRIRASVSEESQMKNTITSLRPWENLDIPLEVAETRFCSLMTGTLPVASDLEAVKAALSYEFEASDISVVSEDRDCYYLLVVCLKAELPDVQELLRQYGAVLMNFHGMQGTAKENIQSGTQYIHQLEKKNEELIKQIADHAGCREDIKRRIDYYTTCMERAAAGGSFYNTEHVVYFEGWVPVSDVEEMKARLAKFDCAWELDDPEPEEYPEVPVKLSNSKFSKPLNMVTEMYSLPAYDGVDPNPLMAPFFILFYGIMMADMGYGLLMILASIVMITKKKPKGGMYNFSYLLCFCGISTLIFGFLTGGFFGDFLTQIARLINPESTFELWYLFSPLEDTMMILGGSLALGFIQMITGMVVSVVKKFKDGEVISAIGEEIAWWLILAGIIVVALAALMGIGSTDVGLVILCIGGGVFVIGQFAIKKSFIGGFVGVFAGLYNNVTGIFSDILSYSRLMALMLSGSIIATVFNTLGAVPGNIVIFIIVAMIGNALNFVLNILSCYVHDLRLQCLEFFGRFYKDGGKAFKPLQVNSKYYNVLKEEN